MNPQLPVSFPGWKEALARSNLSPVVQAAHTREILTFLHLCKTKHAPATVALAKQHLAAREPQTTADAGGQTVSPARAALRWFFWGDW